MCRELLNIAEFYLDKSLNVNLVYLAHDTPLKAEDFSEFNADVGWYEVQIKPGDAVKAENIIILYYGDDDDDWND